MNKKNTSGKVFDKMERICVWLLAYDPNCPKKYRRSLWEPLRNYLDQAEACAEMAYLEIDNREKLTLVANARKYFRMFKRYHERCEITGEFRFSNVYSLDMMEHIEDIEMELNRWYASIYKLVSRDAAAASSNTPSIS